MANDEYTVKSFYPQDKDVHIRRYKFDGETFYIALFGESKDPQYTIVPLSYYSNERYWHKAGVLSRLLRDGHEYIEAYRWLDKTSNELLPMDVSEHAPLSFISRVFANWDTVNELMNLYTEKPTPAMLALVKACKDRFYSPKLRKSVQDANKTVREHTPNMDKSGWVYLVRSMSGHFKIGLSTNPSFRQETFNVKLPFEVYPVCLIHTSNALKLERELHDRYSSSRKNGSEFFDLTWDDVQDIKRLAL